MLSDLASMLYISSVVGGDVQSVHKFCDEGAGKGLLLGRKVVAKVFDVPDKHIRYMPRGMMGNVDDMVYMSSTRQGCVATNKDKDWS